MKLTALNAINPIDGRYLNKTQSLSAYFSESALIYYRLLVEIRWFQTLAVNKDIKEVPALSESSNHFLQRILDDFNEQQSAAVKKHESVTNHDVKAIEYYLGDKFETHDALSDLKGFIHFALTSEDINNIAYAMMIKNAISNVILPELAEIAGGITLLGKQYADSAMLSRTHGQPATPTTMGKELINVVSRLKRPMQQLSEVLISAKCNGAVGNYNAHYTAYPDIDWRRHCSNFISSLGLDFNAYTTQIEPHDCIAEVSHIMTRINNIFLDYAQDMWTYIAIGYFKQRPAAHEVGSSTMPHKINPIDFENAEGNLGMANALFIHFSNKLTKSRLQRDLSDSTVMRNIGVAFAYSLIAFKSLAKGNSKLQLDKQRLHNDLEQNWEVLAEAIQTVMRRYKIPNAYELLKSLTRGQGIDEIKIKSFIQDLAIPENEKKRLLSLTPHDYTGVAVQLVKAFS